MTDRIRVLRVLEYEGPREWVENTLANNAVKGEKRFSKNGDTYIIRESIVGETPVVLSTARIPATYHWSNCSTLRAPSSICDCGAEPVSGSVYE